MTRRLDTEDIKVRILSLLKGRPFRNEDIRKGMANLLHWIKFFLVAVITTAEKGQETFKSILALKNEVDGQIVSLGRRAENARNLLLHLYQQPVITANTVSEVLSLAPRAANALIKDMEGIGILREVTGFKRNRLFMFEKYLHLF